MMEWLSWISSTLSSAVPKAKILLLVTSWNTGKEREEGNGIMGKYEICIFSGRKDFENLERHAVSNLIDLCRNRVLVR